MILSCHAPVTTIAVFPSAIAFNQLASRAAKMQKHILIADDDSIIRQVVKDGLTAALDIDCQKAANGREAIERAEQTKPDLIILDVAKPELDGITAAKRLKQSMRRFRSSCSPCMISGKIVRKILAWMRLCRSRKDSGS